MRNLLFAFFLAVAGCASPPQFAAVAPSLPAVPPGDARIYVYRSLEPYETLSITPLYLNGATVAETAPGSVLYRDVPAGRYLVAVRSEGEFPNQFKTITLRPGDTAYVRVESLRSWSPCPLMDETGCWDTFTVNVIDPAVARSEIQDLRLISG